MYIHSAVRITNKGVWRNNQPLPINREISSSWLGAIYKSLNFQYPKFHKMDSLCKLGFLSSEIAMEGNIIEEGGRKDWSVLIVNHCSSTENDKEYQKTIQSNEAYYPSPSVFVYTLSNIITGEIAIRHKIMGESCSFIEKQFNAESIYNNALLGLLPDKEIRHLLIGWIDYLDGKCDALLFHVSLEKEGNIAPLEPATIESFYQIGL